VFKGLIHWVLTNLMEQSPSWGAKGWSASQEIPHILWNLKARFRIHKILPTVHILNRINPVHAPHPTYWRPIIILSSHLHLSLPRNLFPSSLATKILCALPLSPIRATCLAHLFLFWLDNSNNIWRRVQISGDKIKKNEMSGACSAHRGKERRIQDFGGETLGKETTWETQA